MEYSIKSQSPQAGQFNSYTIGRDKNLEEISLNPLKRVNSILTVNIDGEVEDLKVSIPSSGSIQFLLNVYKKDWEDIYESQSLKRVNSFTPYETATFEADKESQSSSGSIHSYRQH